MKAMSHSLPVENISVCEPTCEPDVAKQVGKEILENRLDPAAWATALSSCGGKRQEALAAYARIRIKQIGTRRRLSQSKFKSFECRRITQCFGVKSVQDLLQRSHPGKPLNFLRPHLSVLSLTTLGIGTAGSTGSLGRLFVDDLPDFMTSTLPLLTMLAGIAMVGLALALRYLLPRRAIMLGWNTGLVAACTMACFISLFCGVTLFSQAEPFHSQEPVKKEIVTISPTAHATAAPDLAAITAMNTR